MRSLLYVLATILLSLLVMGLLMMFNPPSRVDVNGASWVITLQHFPDDNLAGITFCETRTIALSDTLRDPRETILHELMHASVCGDAADGFEPKNLYFNSTTENKHEGIYHASTVFSSILVRNPQLDLYLMGNVRAW